MNLDLPVFRIGDSNTYVQPGDLVWTDIIIAKSAGRGHPPVLFREPISGKVMNDGTVLLANDVFVPLRQCRICRTEIDLPSLTLDDTDAAILMFKNETLF